MISPFLNHRPAGRYKYGCTGIKCCEYLLDELKDSNHTVVDEALYEKLRQIKSHIPKNPTDPKQKVMRCASLFVLLSETDLSVYPPVKWEGIIDAVNRLPVDVAER